MLDCLTKPGTPTYRKVVEELGERMDKMGDHTSEGDRKLVDEYFTTVLASALGSSNADWLDRPWNPKFIACFAVTGTSEGHYIHVDVYPGRYALGGRADEKPLHLALGKTFQGFDHAWRIARACAEQLGA